MSKKSHQNEPGEELSPEAEVSAAAAETLEEITVTSVEETVIEEISEVLAMSEMASGEEAAEMVESDALPEVVTEEALSGEVPQGAVPRLSHVIEAILFASQKAVSPKELVAHLKSAATAEPNSVAAAFARIKETSVREALTELQAEVAASGRAYQVRETATGWLLCSTPGFAPWLRALYPEAKPTRLSAPALETLAIIAYRQPITRADMEAVRGVAVDGVMQTLVDRGLVKIAGRAEVAGRPLLYATTQYFLDHFGLRHLDELPNAAELRHIPLPKATPEPATAEKEAPKDSSREATLELPMTSGVTVETSVEIAVTGEVVVENASPAESQETTGPGEAPAEPSTPSFES